MLHLDREHLGPWQGGYASLDIRADLIDTRVRRPVVTLRLILDCYLRS